MHPLIHGIQVTNTLGLWWTSSRNIMLGCWTSVSYRIGGSSSRWVLLWVLLWVLSRCGMVKRGAPIKWILFYTFFCVCGAGGWRLSPRPSRILIRYPLLFEINLKIFKNNSISLKNTEGYVKKHCSFNKNLLI